MRPVAVTIACAAALSACDSGPNVEARDATPAEVARKMDEARAGDQFVRAGKWRSQVTIEQLDMPGVPAEIAGQMKAMMARHQERTNESCLTEEEAKRPKEDFFAGKDNNCRYDHFTMGGGKIDARMRCAGQGGMSQVMEMSGTYSPDSYRMRMATRTEGAGAPGMTMKLRVDSARIGACDDKPA